MIEIVNGAFSSPPDQGKEPVSHFDYEISLTGRPDLMALCDADSGVFADQIEFEYVDYGKSTEDRHALVILLYAGRANPAYKRALDSLFGVEVGDILCATGDTYDNAVIAADDARTTGAPPVYTLGVMLDLLTKIATEELASRVYHRLMINPSFL